MSVTYITDKTEITKSIEFLADHIATLTDTLNRIEQENKALREKLDQMQSRLDVPSDQTTSNEIEMLQNEVENLTQQVQILTEQVQLADQEKKKGFWARLFGH